jgi:hypothetical protein
MTFCCILLLAAAGLLHSVAAASADAPVIVVEVASASSFRLGVRFFGAPVAPIASPMVDPAAAPAPSVPVSWGGMSGLSTSFGALLAAPDGSSWALYDATNTTLVASRGPPVFSGAFNASADPGITLPVAGVAAGGGVGEPCLSNGMFGPPFYYNRAAGYFALATSSSPYDPMNPHCYPVTFDSSPPSAAAAPRVGGDPAVCSAGDRHAGTDVTNPRRSPNYPGGAKVADADACCALCVADSLCTSWVFGNGDPTGNCWPLAHFDKLVAVGDRVFGGPTPPAAWWGMGAAVDWYLSPAAAPLDSSRALYELTGPPALPPYYAMGFMATYWGFETMEYVEGNMTAFRDGAFPIDSMCVAVARTPAAAVTVAALPLLLLLLLHDHAARRARVEQCGA